MLSEQILGFIQTPEDETTSLPPLSPSTSRTLLRTQPRSLCVLRDSLRRIIKPSQVVFHQTETTTPHIEETQSEPEGSNSEQEIKGIYSDTTSLDSREYLSEPEYGNHILDQ